MKAPLSEKTVDPIPVRREENAGYFVVQCKARGQVEQAIIQKWKSDQRVDLDSISLADLNRWDKDGVKYDPVIKTKVVRRLVNFATMSRFEFDRLKKQGLETDPELEKKLDQLFDAQDRVKAVLTIRTVASTGINAIKDEQQRILGIIRDLPEDSPAVKKYVDQLSDTESQLAQSRTRLAEIDSDLKTAREEVARLIKQ